MLISLQILFALYLFENILFNNLFKSSDSLPRPLERQSHTDLIFIFTLKHTSRWPWVPWNILYHIFCTENKIIVVLSSIKGTVSDIHGRFTIVPFNLWLIVVGRELCVFISRMVFKRNVLTQLTLHIFLENPKYHVSNTN